MGRNRLQFLITLIVVSILFVWLSFVTLAQGILIHAFYWSQLGFVIVIPLIFQTIILLSGYSEPNKHRISNKEEPREDKQTQT